MALSGARIGTALIGDQATLDGILTMEGAQIGTTLFLCGTRLLGGADILFCSAQNVDLRGTEIRGELDLTGMSASGELRLGETYARWTNFHPKARLVLRNTHFGAIQDSLGGKKRVDVWPEKANLHLDGFEYDHLGGLRGDDERDDMMGRNVGWYVDWLARDTTYSPAPYQQLAKILREAGATGKANAIVYAARERERAQSRGVAWLGRTLLKYTIGYGLGGSYFRALVWVLLFTAIGATVLLTCGSPKITRLGPVWCTWASFDAMIPLVQLNAAHEKVMSRVLSGWRLYYFYVHQMLAYVLGSFVVAGLGGLTQRQ